METSKTDLPVSDHTPRPASPTRGNHPDKLQTVAWSLKRHRPDDPVFLRQSLGDKVGDADSSLESVALPFKASVDRSLPHSSWLSLSLFT